MVWSRREGQRGHLKGGSAKGAGARQDLRLSTHQFPKEAEPVCYPPQPLRQTQLLRSSKDQRKRQQHGPLLVTDHRAQIGTMPKWPMAEMGREGGGKNNGLWVTKYSRHSMQHLLVDGYVC